MGEPRNATTASSGARTYDWPPTGETFDSVTTIIQGGTPTPWGLQKWFKSVNVRYAVENHKLWLPIAENDPQAAIDLIVGQADRDRDKASIRGKDVHDWAEGMVLGTAEGEPPAELAGYVKSFVQFLEDWQPAYEMTEATVYSRSHGYAGTLDWIARIEGHGLVLGDYKTKPDGKTIYGEIALQLAAYRYADFIGLPDGSEVPMPEVDACLALVIHPSSYELIPVRADEEAHRAFLHVMEVRRFCTQTAKTCLAKKLFRPAPSTATIEEAVAS